MFAKTIILSCAFCYCLVNLHASETFLYNCRETKKPPVIDGKLTDEVWTSDTEIISDFHKFGSSEKVKYKTLASLAYDTKHIYACFLMQKGYKEKINKKGKLFSSDSVEIFLAPAPADLSRYYHAAVGHNEYFTLSKNMGRTDTRLIDGIKFAAQELPAAWSIEVAIPFSWMQKVPKPGDVWKFNLCRNDPVHGLFTFSNVKYGFHEPENFASLVFTEESSKAASSLGKPEEEQLISSCKLAIVRKELDSLNENNPVKSSLNDQAKELSDILEKAKNFNGLAGNYLVRWQKWNDASIEKNIKEDLQWKIKTALLFE